MSKTTDSGEGEPRAPRAMLEAEARQSIAHRKSLSWMNAALALIEKMFQGAAFGAADRLHKDPLDVWADMADILRVLREKLQEIQCWKSMDEGENE